MTGLADFKSKFNLESESEYFDAQWCCYIRPAPSGISLDTHYTCNQVLDAIDRQRWTPKYCYYCYCCPLRNDPDAWENHVIRNHPGKLAYPGSGPTITLKILEIIEERERRNKVGRV